ncbi:class I adenylate-forming enzyme family protein [Plantactinospora sp. KBS50]|uniref:class I adenylate-forming enzyme family protein n=1 Tax=Plantactinospora sp. KBS50 TaxID=2024580 RepID=UPI000BAB17D3|nr:AMP-binding protein [Plantactinospora sp. KBS50]ASW56768.1 acyl-CoA synthase [Plantactinospora sp. KBS50]
MNVVEQLRRRAQQGGWTGRPAVHTASGVWTYGRLYDRVARVAGVLRRHGVRPGQRVLIAVPDGFGWLASFLAVGQLGCTAVPVNPELTAADHRFLADDCASALVICGPELAPRFDAGRWIDPERLLAEADGADPVAPVPATAPLYVHYTSGTTGRPKGVVHPHGNLPVYHGTVGRALGVRPADVTLSVSKLYFTYGFCNSLVFPLYSGGSSVLLEHRPGPAEVAELATRYGVTLLYAVPSWYARAVADLRPGAFRTLRQAVSGGERLTARLTERAAELLGAPLLNQLGATEIGCAATANTPGHDVPGSIGRPVPGFTVQVRDAAGAPVPPGVEGHLWVTGPAMMSGYLDRPADTAAVLVDGWLHTRDLVVGAPDGTYEHVSRADDLEMVGGITMSPMEVEDVLITHPGVREVAVAAVPDEVGATRLRAFVVPARPQRPADDLAAELIALARSRLAAFKVPRSVLLVDALPRTATGKLRRFALRQRAAAPAHPANERTPDHVETRS